MLPDISSQDRRLALFALIIYAIIWIIVMACRDGNPSYPFDS